MKKKKTGPRQKTIKDRNKNEIMFFVEDEKMKVHFKIINRSCMEMSGIQIRSLRNWLNWYLDNK